MLNCSRSDFILGENCIKERSVGGCSGEESDTLLEKIRHLSEFRACWRGEDSDVVVQNDDSGAVQRNSDITANDSEIGASLFKSFGALCQIIDRNNNKSNAGAIALQMPCNCRDEFCIVAIRWSDGDFKNLRPLGKAQR